MTLKKSETDYSPTTMYRDYPISPTLFHWESQSTTSRDHPPASDTSVGSSHILIFARQEQNESSARPRTSFLGPAHHATHTGDRPIAITWRLEHEMPMDFFTIASAVAQ